ncbi:MAG: flippase [Chloroflexi bacterium]|nr:flippase [Chloroflexota bacterium]MBT7081391.1 flippase [Chloroflexota bacterium]MBT7290421.1 flippase [Chloroflexota bacterium]
MVRGTTYLVVAHVVFLFSGYIIHIVLGRHFGPETYGNYGVVLNLMTTINLLLISGFPQAASKYIAEDKANIGSIVKTSIRIQALFAGITFGIYFGLAGVIANLLNDDSLVNSIRISALVVPVYAIFVIYNNGYLNGLGYFGKQAKTLILSSIVKVAAVLALVFIGFMINGAILGYLIAAVIGLFFASRYLGRLEKSDVSFDWKKLLRFGVPATFVSMILFLLMNIDLFLLKGLASASDQAGYYTSATTLAKVPYFIMGALALSLMPSISKSTFVNDIQLTQSYIRQSTRYMLMFLMPVVLVISATSGGLIELVYTAEYSEAARSLAVLILGLSMLSVFLVLANVIMGSGRPLIPMFMGFVLVFVDIGLNLYLIPRYDMLGAAWATTITASLGAFIAAIYVVLVFKTLISFKSFMRVCVASLLVWTIPLYVYVTPVLLPFVYIGLALLYLGVLMLIKELRKDDLEMLKRVFPSSRFR